MTIKDLKEMLSEIWYLKVREGKLKVKKSGDRDEKVYCNSGRRDPPLGK